MSHTPRLSVVIATYNRTSSLKDLLADLERQTLRDFEVVVVDDGSREPVASHLAEERSFPLRVLTQANAGAAAARHRGVEHAGGRVIVILDDDMRVGPEFLAAHLAEHERGATLVLGNIAFDAPRDEGARHVLDKFQAKQHRSLLEGYRSGARVPRGADVCTGNVSFRREDYLAIGGFDRALPRCEDRDLGVRLERAGAKIVFADAAHSTHVSDVGVELWLHRAFLYGVYDPKIAEKHPSVEYVDPWAFVFRVNAITRPFVALTVLEPALGTRLGKLAYRAAEALDHVGAERAAIAGVTFAYGLHYFAGVRTDAGTLRTSLRRFRRYLGKRRAAR